MPKLREVLFGTLPRSAKDVLGPRAREAHNRLGEIEHNRRIAKGGLGEGRGRYSWDAEPVIVPPGPGMEAPPKRRKL